MDMVMKSFLIMIFAASYAVSDIAWRIVLITAGLIIFVIGLVFAMKIETKAGYYECGNCHYRYVPSYKATFFSPHTGRTRYMRCPKCGMKTWNKKVLTKNDEEDID